MKFAIVFIFIILVIIGLFLVYFYTRGETSFQFEKTIHTLVPENEVWDATKEAFKDSENSTVWPNDYSVVKSDGLQDGAEIAMTYKMPFVSKTYHYTVSNYEEGKTFTYASTDDHPLWGEVTITLEPWDGGTKLTWEGSYKYDGFSFTALYFRMFFQQGFLNQLEENIRAL